MFQLCSDGELCYLPSVVQGDRPSDDVIVVENNAIALKAIAFGEGKER